MIKPWVIVLGILGTLASKGAADGDGVEFFRNEVKPILEENCFKCHGGIDDKGHPKVRGGLQLISRKGLLIGGDHGPGINEAERGVSGAITLDELVRLAR